MGMSSSVDYWTERAERCFTVADEIEHAHRRDRTAAKTVKIYRLAASNWRKAAQRADSDDPISRDMVGGNAKDGAHFEALADRQRQELDGTPIPPEPTAYPSPTDGAQQAEQSTPKPKRSAQVGSPDRRTIEQARAKLGDLVIAAMHGEETTITRHGRPAARIVPMGPPPSREEFMNGLARELEELRTRMVIDEDQGPRLVVPVGEDGWALVTMDPYGQVSIQEASDETGHMVGGFLAYDLRTVKEAADALRRSQLAL